MPFAHLVYAPIDEINFLSWTFNAPDFLKYGHVFVVLQSEKDFCAMDINWSDVQPLRFTRLSVLELVIPYHKMMRVGHVSPLFIQDEIISPDINFKYASFQISADEYQRAKQQFANTDNMKVPYHRLHQNCVFYAAAHMRIAGVDLGNSVGYTAGRFFDKAKEQSLGDLLTAQLQPQVEVIERGVIAPQGQAVVRETIDIEAMARDL